jgi:hypothetical protein
MTPTTRIRPDSGTVSVPGAAKAGDLIPEDCDYAIENGSYAADCAERSSSLRTGPTFAGGYSRFV